MSIAFSTRDNVRPGREYVYFKLCVRETHRKRERKREKQNEREGEREWVSKEVDVCVRERTVREIVHCKFRNVTMHTRHPIYNDALKLTRSLSKPLSRAHTHVPAFSCVRTWKFELGGCFWSWSRHSRTDSTILAKWSVFLGGGGLVWVSDFG